MVEATVTATAPNIPKIGSTIPDSWPYQNARPMLKPAACNGKLTANPSGKFCIPIPMARFLQQQTNQTNEFIPFADSARMIIAVTYLADSNVADSVLPIAPKLTPTASPSGILCTVIAITNSIIRFHCDSAFA